MNEKKNVGQIHGTSKRYHEYLAKLVLEFFFPERFGTITVKDKPDLWGSFNVDAEVSEIDINYDHFIVSLFQWLRGKTKNEIGNDTTLRKKCSQLYHKNYKLLFVNDCVIGVTTNDAFIEDFVDTKNAFEKKIKKISSYDKTVDLFLYSPSMEYYSDEEINEFGIWISTYQSSFPRFYHNIYVFDYQKCFVINGLNGSVSQLCINSNIITDFIRQATEYSNKN